MTTVGIGPCRPVIPTASGMISTAVPLRISSVMPLPAASCLAPLGLRQPWELSARSSILPLGANTRGVSVRRLEGSRLKTRFLKCHARPPSNHCARVWIVSWQIRRQLAARSLAPHPAVDPLLFPERGVFAHRAGPLATMFGLASHSGAITVVAPAVSGVETAPWTFENRPLSVFCTGPGAPVVGANG